MKIKVIKTNSKSLFLGPIMFLRNDPERKGAFSVTFENWKVGDGKLR